MNSTKKKINGCLLFTLIFAPSIIPTITYYLVGCHWILIFATMTGGHIFSMVLFGLKKIGCSYFYTHDITCFFLSNAIASFIVFPFVILKTKDYLDTFIVITYLAQSIIVAILEATIGDGKDYDKPN